MVIMLHGYSSSKESGLYREFDGEFNEVGITTCRMSYFGHGKAYGDWNGYGATPDVTLTKAYDSLDLMIRLVQEKGEENIVLLGSSFGGLLAMRGAACHKDIKGLVLKSAVIEPKRFWRQRIRNNERGIRSIAHWQKEGVLDFKFGVEDYKLDFEFWRDIYEHDTLAEARNISCPTMIIHGEDDTSIPLEQSEHISRITNEPISIVPGADHAYSGEEQQKAMKKLIFDFVSGVLE